MKKNVIVQKEKEIGAKYTCKITFPSDLPMANRKNFVRDAKKLGHHDGNKAQDDCIHLIFDSSLERRIMHAVANKIGYQVENTNRDGE